MKLKETLIKLKWKSSIANRRQLINMLTCQCYDIVYIIKQKSMLQKKKKTENNSEGQTMLYPFNCFLKPLVVW